MPGMPFSQPQDSHIQRCPPLLPLNSGNDTCGDGKQHSTRTSGQSNLFLFGKVHPKPLNMHSFIVTDVCYVCQSVLKEFITIVNRWTEYGGISVTGESDGCFEIIERGI